MVLSYLGTILGISRHTHIIEPSYSIDDESVEVARGAFGRMASGEPLQYVSGKAYFYGREFNVSPDVLIPRPETEILCREVCNHIGASIAPRILDLCTGSGCIAWTLALEIPGASVVAADISDGALSVASAQPFDDEAAGIHAVRPCFMKADVLAGPSALPGHHPASFDVLVSNPPYVMDSEKALMRPNVLEHEPHLALFVPDSDPLVFYRSIADWAGHYLKKDGFAMVEINEALGPQTAAIYSDAGFGDVRIVKDLNEKDRFVMFHR